MLTEVLVSYAGTSLDDLGWRPIGILPNSLGHTAKDAVCNFNPSQLPVTLGATVQELDAMHQHVVLEIR